MAADRDERAVIKRRITEALRSSFGLERAGQLRSGKLSFFYWFAQNPSGENLNFQADFASNNSQLHETHIFCRGRALGRPVWIRS